MSDTQSDRRRLIELQAGPLRMLFDSDNGFLRYVSLGDKELVRCVFAAVRDHNWDTVPFAINDLRVDQFEKHFRIAFVANSLQPEVPFTWNGTIEGVSNGSIRFHFRGIVQSPFSRNRIGLCVLHPSNTCAGEACRIDHCDGSMTLGQFPRMVSPHQPFKNIRSMTQFVEPDMQLNVTMEGDTFEMEDQRNWTDASFKTYSTPLDIPFPVRLATGDTIEQSVTIELRDLTPNQASVTTERLGELARHTVPRMLTRESRIDINWKKTIPRPAVGFQLPIDRQSPSIDALDALKALRPDHLRSDLRLAQDDWRDEWKRSLGLSQAIQAPLELAVFVESASGSHWSEWLDCVAESQSSIARILLFHAHLKSTPTHLIEQAHQALKRTAASIPFVVGTNAYFAELNRERPSSIPDRQVCYSINPQVHAFDNLSLCETLSAQRDTVDTAVHLFDSDIVISPITLRPRFNPNATTSVDWGTQLHAAIDPRQKTGFGAAWSVGVFANLLTHPLVCSATFFEAFGARGIMGADGFAYPMATSFSHLLRCSSLFRGVGTSPHEVVAFGSERDDGQFHFVCGNLSVAEQTVHFRTREGTEREWVIPPESVKILLIEESGHA